MKPNGVTDTESEESGKSQKRAAKKIRHSDDEDYKPSPSKRKKGKLSKSPRKTHGPNAMNQGMWNKEREAYLCEMWEEEECLYKVDHPLYRCPTTKAVVLKRIASSLGFVDPDVVTKHMRNMRTTLSKTLQPPKSGSSPKPPSTRERTIIELCGFLKDHILRMTYSRSGCPAQAGDTSTDGNWKQQPNSEEGTEPWDATNEETEDVDDGDDDDMDAASTSAADTPNSNTPKPEEAGDENSMEQLIPFESLPKGLVKIEESDNEDERCSTVLSATSAAGTSNMDNSLEAIQGISANMEKLVDMTVRTRAEQQDVDNCWARVVISYIQKMPEAHRHLFRTAVQIMAVRAMEDDWSPDLAM